ncbi:MAG: peptidoglycan DD-metalloendopeptidase family protein [Patescibacteria group bacterium]|jgi:murein DD-endopeptidase MepM/ murein hydrolase activator NlpD
MKRKSAIIFGLIVCTILGTEGIVFAEAGVDEMQQEIADKKAEAEQIQKQIDSYRSKVQSLSTQAASLLNDIALIENQNALLELEIQGTQANIASQELELQYLGDQIQSENVRLEHQKELLSEMLFELEKNQGVELVEVIFNAGDFDELFAGIEALESLNSDLSEAVEGTKLMRTTLEENRAKQEVQLDALMASQIELQNEQTVLEQQKNAKDLLVQETRSSESEYRVLMSELRQDEQSITNELSFLQSEVEKKLADQDGDGLDIAPDLTPPMQGVITATFHDPTYPFRRLFGEHSGMDIATTYGTPVKAAAPGIIAYARVGKSFGNYVMIIHEGGMATLYAHMSGFNVTADQYVERGDVIGYEGSTGFSTGPHLHFEVRLNGIPVDPAQYVIGW